MCFTKNNTLHKKERRHDNSSFRKNKHNYISGKKMKSNIKASHFCESDRNSCVNPIKLRYENRSPSKKIER